jgi:hypothetical protein
MSKKFDDIEPPEPEIPVRDSARYVESIVDAAERAAAKIRADAEAEANRYLEEYKRRIDSLVEERTRATDSLAEQATKVRDQYDRFMNTVDSALGRSGDVGNGARPPGPEDPASAADPEPQYEPPKGMLDRLPGVGRSDSEGPPEAVQAPPEPGRFRRRAEPAPAEPRRDPGTTRGGFRPRSQNAAANSLAAQMIAAGSDRKAISKRLRADFDIEDPDEILDQLDFD